MARYKTVNGERVQFTPEEETARDAEETQAALDKTAADSAEATKATNRASAKTKLEALGLTTDEIKDAFGI